MVRATDQSNRLTLLATAVLLGISSLSFAQEPSRQDPAFKIICFPGPPAAENRVEHYARIRRANFNLVLPSYQYDDQQQLRMLDHCQATGLRGVVNVKGLAPPVAEGSPPSNWKQLAAAAIDRFSRHPALYGYMIRDEPSARIFPQLGRVAREFERLDPQHDVCVNLFPIYASSEQLGVDDYEVYLQKYLTTVRPPALCYDHYPFMKRTGDRKDFFQNLEIARRVCLQHDTPLWIVVLSGWWEHFRTPTDAELRWQAYGALAYGIQGISYFTYSPAKEGYASVVDYSGTPQSMYESIKQLNRELSVLGTRLASMHSVGVYHAGVEIPEGCRPLPSDSWLTVDGQPPLAIGLFQNDEGKKSALVMNRSTQHAETAALHFSLPTTAVSLFDAATGRAQELELRDHSCCVKIPAGTGVLLSLGEPPP